MVKMNSVALEPEDVGEEPGSAASDQGYRVEVMRGLRADLREEKAGIRRAASAATRKSSAAVASRSE